MNGRVALSWSLIGIAILATFSHICAAPFHAHAGAMTTHSEDHPERGSDEAAHGGSCEALRTSQPDAPALPATGVVFTPAGERQTLAVLPTDAPIPTSSPP